MNIQFNSIQLKSFIYRWWPSKFTTYLPWGPSKHENKYNNYSYIYTK